MDTNFIYNEYDEAHRMLTDIRRQYDDVKATTQSRKKEIELQKKELEDLHAQEKMLSS
jgi:membrane-bound lytic murein transglycosylase MltF